MNTGNIPESKGSFEFIVRKTDLDLKNLSKNVFHYHDNKQRPSANGN